MRPSLHFASDTENNNNNNRIKELKSRSRLKSLTSEIQAQKNFLCVKPLNQSLLKSSLPSCPNSINRHTTRTQHSEPYRAAVAEVLLTVVLNKAAFCSRIYLCALLFISKRTAILSLSIYQLIFAKEMRRFLVYKYLLLKYLDGFDFING